MRLLYKVNINIYDQLLINSSKQKCQLELLYKSIKFNCKSQNYNKKCKLQKITKNITLLNSYPVLFLIMFEFLTNLF